MPPLTGASGGRRALSLGRVDANRTPEERNAIATMATENVLRPTTWAEVYAALFAETFNPRTARFKSRFAYRGVSSAAYGLETSLMRLGGEYAKVEPHLIRQFRKYASRYVPEYHSFW